MDVIYGTQSRFWTQICSVCVLAITAISAISNWQLVISRTSSPTLFVSLCRRSAVADGSTPSAGGRP